LRLIFRSGGENAQAHASAAAAIVVAGSGMRRRPCPATLSPKCSNACFWAPDNCCVQLIFKRFVLKGCAILFGTGPSGRDVSQNIL